MIQKRYQFFSKGGVDWTDWFDTLKRDNELNTLNVTQKWQIKGKLLNEFRLKL